MAGWCCAVALPRSRSATDHGLILPGRQYIPRFARSLISSRQRLTTVVSRPQHAQHGRAWRRQAESAITVARQSSCCRAARRSWNASQSRTKPTGTSSTTAAPVGMHGFRDLRTWPARSPRPDGQARNSIARACALLVHRFSKGSLCDRHRDLLCTPPAFWICGPARGSGRSTCMPRTCEGRLRPSLPAGARSSRRTLPQTPAAARRRRLPSSRAGRDRPAR